MSTLFFEKFYGNMFKAGGGHADEAEAGTDWAALPFARIGGRLKRL
jgi:hypothetical protein